MKLQFKKIWAKVWICLLFYTFFLTNLLLNQTFEDVHFIFWIFPLIFMPLLIKIFQVIFKSHSKLFVIGFIIPFSVLYTFHSISLPGLGKAHWHDQLFSLLLVWILLIITFYLVLLIFKAISKKRKQTIE